MELLKKIPITFKGELHEIRLINFSVDINEIINLVPPKIKIRTFENNRALISMVNVRLRKMHPSFLPSTLSFSYQHVAFRLLVDDSEFNNGNKKGIYFLQSFTNNPFIVFGGSLITEYKLASAELINDGSNFTLRYGKLFISYNLFDSIDVPSNKELKQTIGTLDRAYSVLENKVRVTIIQREKWPIEEINCKNFQTNFFKSAQFEGSFKVREMIPYTWLPPKTILR